MTMSLTLIHTRRFIFPLILLMRVCPSMHFTIIRSKPNIFSATPSTSWLSGVRSSIDDSVIIFFFPRPFPSTKRARVNYPLNRISWIARNQLMMIEEAYKSAQNSLVVAQCCWARLLTPVYESQFLVSVRCLQALPLE